MCDFCKRFFARFRCNKPDECDCPKCQGMCECPEEEKCSNCGRGEDANLKKVSPRVPNTVRFEGRAVYCTYCRELKRGHWKYAG